MIPTVAHPLASTASGAALASAAPPPPLPAGGLAAAAAVAQLADAFVGIAKKTGLLPGAAPAASRPSPSGQGYAAGAARSTASARTSTAKKTSTAKAATAAKPKAAAPKKTGPLAFLEDRGLSVEEKLMRLLAYLNDKWDKDLEKKLKEIEAGQQKASASTAAAGAAKKKSGGLLGSLGAAVKAASGFFPAVGVAVEALKNPVVRAALSKLGGPVLAAAATALGYPALAPLLARYGPAAIDLAAGVATSLDDGPSSASASGGASAGGAAPSGSSPSATGMNDSELRLKIMEIERIQNLQKEMFTLVSNILRAGHETRMNVIQNVR